MFGWRVTTLVIKFLCGDMRCRSPVVSCCIFHQLIITRGKAMASLINKHRRCLFSAEVPNAVTSSEIAELGLIP